MNFDQIKFSEVMDGIRTDAELVILDFPQIPQNTPTYKNMKLFFGECERNGIDPKLPQNRQRFNNNFLSYLGKRYLIGRYAENRSAMLKGSRIAKEGRTLHLGVDIFSKDLEEIYSPADGIIIRTATEPGNHSYGNYIIIEHNQDGNKWYSFFGHLSKELPSLGPVKKGGKLTRIGDFIDNENGGWSRHLHYQILTDLPPLGQAPIGYSTKKGLIENEKRFPNPNIVLRLNCL